MQMLDYWDLHFNIAAVVVVVDVVVTVVIFLSIAPQTPRGKIYLRLSLFKFFLSQGRRGTLIKFYDIGSSLCIDKLTIVCLGVGRRGMWKQLSQNSATLIFCVTKSPYFGTEVWKKEISEACLVTFSLGSILSYRDTWKFIILCQKLILEAAAAACLVTRLKFQRCRRSRPGACTGRGRWWAASCWRRRRACPRSSRCCRDACPHCK